MKKSGIDKVYTIRNAIYVLGIVAFIIAILVKSCHASEIESLQDNGPQTFWPPDLIPHPHDPNGGPSGPGKPELA